MTSIKAIEQTAESQRYRGRMSRNALSADGRGSSGFELENPTAQSESSPDVKSTPSAEDSPKRTATDNASVLGESTKPRKKRGWLWALRKLRHGYPVSRHGWALELFPKRMRMHVEGFRETEKLFCTFEDGRAAPFTRLTWEDLNALDWFVPVQLELTK